MSTQTTAQTLEQERERAADDAFAAFHFGESRTVTDSDGWTRDGVYWSRWVYGDDTDEPEGRFRVSFGVEFAPESARIVEQWAQA